MKTAKKLELLAPAKDCETAIQAILHGADAVYIGPPSHGARKAAANSLDDIRRVVDFAHIYRARVYVTVNTLIYSGELLAVEKLIGDLYRIGVDALIVQDMGVLRLDIPPIELHASTQCDIRTPEKALFLQEVGFSQLVLARELSLKEIDDICRIVSVPVETFIHGALCVSYSGVCHASWITKGRSANRGECAQLCRLPYTLTDASGKVLAKDKYLLSLRDFNASQVLPDLIEAGVSSFKIEGRLKDVAYVKNVVAYYNSLLNRIVKDSEGAYCRASAGESRSDFTPDIERSFNRGFTQYFLRERRPESIASLLTPKSLGKEVKSYSDLKPGDGVSFFTHDGKYEGGLINKVTDRGLVLAGNVRIPRGAKLRLTRSNEWEQHILKPSAVRKISVSINLYTDRIEATDGREMRVAVRFEPSMEPARKEFDPKPYFEKLGNTSYKLSEFKSYIPEGFFIPASQLTAARREVVAALDKAASATYPFGYRRAENPDAKYPETILTYSANVANPRAEEFYREHGVERIEPALEVQNAPQKSKVVMVCRHCILRELGRCKRDAKQKLDEPLKITSGNVQMQLDFDCKNCEMCLISI